MEREQINKPKKDSSDLEIIANQTQGPSRCIYCHSDFVEAVESLFDKSGNLVASYHSRCRAEEQRKGTPELSFADLEAFKQYRENREASEEDFVKTQIREAFEITKEIHSTYGLIHKYFGIEQVHLPAGVVSSCSSGFENYSLSIITPNAERGNVLIHADKKIPAQFFPGCLGYFTAPLLPIALPIAALFLKKKNVDLASTVRAAFEALGTYQREHTQQELHLMNENHSTSIDFDFDFILGARAKDKDHYKRLIPTLKRMRTELAEALSELNELACDKNHEALDERIKQYRDQLKEEFRKTEMLGYLHCKDSINTTPSDLKELGFDGA